MQCAILSSLNLHPYRPQNAKEEKKKKIENQKSEVSIFPKVSNASCTEISYFPESILFAPHIVWEICDFLGTLISSLSGF